MPSDLTGEIVREGLPPQSRPDTLGGRTRAPVDERLQQAAANRQYSQTMYLYLSTAIVVLRLLISSATPLNRCDNHPTTRRLE
nr:hypothetical protein [Actinocatenispora thailandica]